jgi:exopolyphosphatase / guanosine-5'-triphosphate,3'-diphosphate pyrophosphatase
MNANGPPTEEIQPKPEPARPVAVIDIGTSSVRMAIAQIGPNGSVRTLETLQQPVSLGKDTFTRGVVGKSTIEECVATLRSFRQVLQQYGVTDSRQIRAVATSAVREAANREALLDRVFMATGIDVDVIDEAEVNRYTYLSVQPMLASDPALRDGRTLVVEIGGGSTQLLLVQNGRVLFSHTYRLGSLRLRETIEESKAPATRRLQIMEDYVRRTLMQILDNVPEGGSASMVVLGGDARFAAQILRPGKPAAGLTPCSVAALLRHANGILQDSVDNLVLKHHLSFPDAETLGPALLAYARLAQGFKLKQILIGQTTLRDGILAEMATRGGWLAEFTQQIVLSAIECGKRYAFDQPHAERVAGLARQLFGALRAEHNLSDRHELILTIAAILHDIGLYVSNRSHHKHSMYLIQNSDLFGLGARDKVLAALVARYHRRAPPRPTHEGYATLGREERIVVSKLAAILRVADCLERGGGRIQRVEFAVEKNRLVITAQNVSDLTLEQFALQTKGQMFEQVYGMDVLLRAGGGGG